MNWAIKGIRTGIKTTAYPGAPERAPGVTSGLPVNGQFSAVTAEQLVARCPTQALSHEDGMVMVDPRRCIHCYRCRFGIEHPVDWQQSYEWATLNSGQHELDKPFHGSTHIIVVDAGDCGACLNEVKQLNNPYYNMHRLGFFITPTPRHADVLLVVGAVTDPMSFVLEKIHDAMPTPKRIVAAGACALFGGVFADGGVFTRRVADLLPVDVEVPGNPPPPLAILHGLLVAVGRKPPASLPTSTLTMAGARQG